MLTYNADQNAASLYFFAPYHIFGKKKQDKSRNKEDLQQIIGSRSVITSIEETSVGDIVPSGLTCGTLGMSNPFSEEMNSISSLGGF